MPEIRDDVLAFRPFLQGALRKLRGTNLLERLNVARRGALSKATHQGPHPSGRHLPQRRCDHMPRLVGAVLLEPREYWQLEGRRRFCAESMTSIPKLDDIPALPAARAWGLCHTHRRHRVLKLKTHPWSDERLDKSIVPIDRGLMRCI